MNLVVVWGNVGKDPVINRTQNGNVHASLSIATNKSYIDTQTGEEKQITKWVPISVWGKAAEDVEAHVKKGTYLFVAGEYTARSYEKNGEKKYITELVASMIGKPFGFHKRQDISGATQQAQGSGQGFDRFGQSRPDPEAPGPAYDQGTLSGQPAGTPATEDDIPF